MNAFGNFIAATSLLSLSLIVNNGLIAVVGIGFVLAGFVWLGLDACRVLRK